jgi:hypothetical protein
MPDTPQLGPKLTELAETILDELLAPGNDASLNQKIDALKAVGGVYLGMQKLAGKLREDEDDVPARSFRDLRRQVEGAA